MARDLGVHGVTIDHPDAVGRRNGEESQIHLVVISNDLKSRPVHSIPLSEEVALRLLNDLTKALCIKRGVRIR